MRGERQSAGAAADDDDAMAGWRGIVARRCGGVIRSRAPPSPRLSAATSRHCLERVVEERHAVGHHLARERHRRRGGNATCASASPASSTTSMPARRAIRIIVAFSARQCMYRRRRPVARVLRRPRDKRSRPPRRRATGAPRARSPQGRRRTRGARRRRARGVAVHAEERVVVEVDARRRTSAIAAGSKRRPEAQAHVRRARACAR